MPAASESAAGSLRWSSTLAAASSSTSATATTSAEPNRTGALQFKGAFDTMTWRSSTDEFWNGFTVGVQGTAVETPVAPAVPAPETVLLLAAGLAALRWVTKRRARG